LRDEAATQGLAASLAAAFKALPVQDAIIELHGNLGAGKTTFTRHLLKTLGVTGRIKSPTYAVVEPHETPDGLSIWHFDFYRFNDPREWEDAGLRDLYASQGLKIAEWPEQAAGLLPEPDLQITLKALDDESREMTLKALTPTGETLLQGLAS
jgi:tRNA threonylcarbamoyladenosine biosynthesis protein TsaE